MDKIRSKKYLLPLKKNYPTALFRKVSRWCLWDKHTCQIGSCTHISVKERISSESYLKIYFTPAGELRTWLKQDWPGMGELQHSPFPVHSAGISSRGIRNQDGRSGIVPVFPSSACMYVCVCCGISRRRYEDHLVCVCGTRDLLNGEIPSLPRSRWRIWP